MTVDNDAGGVSDPESQKNVALMRVDGRATSWQQCALVLLLLLLLLLLSLLMLLLCYPLMQASSEIAVSHNKIVPQDSSSRSSSLRTNLGTFQQQERKSIKFKFVTLLLLLLLLLILLMLLHIVCGLVATVGE